MRAKSLCQRDFCTVEGNRREQRCFSQPTRAALLTATIVPKEIALCLKILIGFYSDLKSEPKIELITWENSLDHLNWLLVTDNHELNYTKLANLYPWSRTIYWDTCQTTLNQWVEVLLNAICPRLTSLSPTPIPYGFSSKFFLIVYAPLPLNYIMNI